VTREPANPLLPGLEVITDPAVELLRTLGPSSVVAGLDEVGRGPLAGPVVAAAVVLDPMRPIEGLNDSKKLTEKRRAQLFDVIHLHARAVGVGVLEAPEIDARNILEASMEAMRLALLECERLLERDIDGALVDGNRPAPLPSRIVQRTVIGGDAISEPIMAASIVAKVIRDRRMVEEAARYPVYGFDKHKGYPTPVHRAALIAHGPCPLHRRSFAPVAEALRERGEA